ncbi:hypothetical protein AB0D04_32010 [Streptomyces sp. NPDC048483]
MLGERRLRVSGDAGLENLDVIDELNIEPGPEESTNPVFSGEKNAGYSMA